MDLGSDWVTEMGWVMAQALAQGPGPAPERERERVQATALHRQLPLLE